MNRREAREQAFVLLFERSFQNCSIQEIVDNAVEGRALELDPFSIELATAAFDHLDQLDQVIQTYSTNWKINRLSKVVLAVLRLSICEMTYLKDIPASVSINEAVELAKKFAGEEEGAFVNGVLGSFVRANSGSQE